MYRIIATGLLVAVMGWLFIAQWGYHAERYDSLSKNVIHLARSSYTLGCIESSGTLVPRDTPEWYILVDDCKQRAAQYADDMERFLQDAVGDVSP